MIDQRKPKISVACSAGCNTQPNGKCNENGAAFQHVASLSLEPDLRKGHRCCKQAVTLKPSAPVGFKRNRDSSSTDRSFLNCRPTTQLLTDTDDLPFGFHNPRLAVRFWTAPAVYGQLRRLKRIFKYKRNISVA